MSSDAGLEMFPDWQKKRRKICAETEMFIISIFLVNEFLYFL